MTETNPAFVLVNPQLGENIGATARAMLNFGFTGMRLVGPRDGWPNPDAVAMASGAGRVLESAIVHDNLSEALAGFDFVLATTARDRDLAKPVMNPEQAAREARQRMADGRKVAIMFGPERTGLDNADLVSANAIIEVPTDAAFKSMNLAQCALLIAYELKRAAAEPGAGPAAGELATHEEKDVLARLFQDDLAEAGYFRPGEKAPSMQQNLRNMFLRLEFGKAEVRAMHGVRKALKRYHP